MNKLIFDKKDLLEKLKENKTKHVEHFKKALKGWQDRVREVAEKEIIAKSESGELTRLDAFRQAELTNDIPTSHEEDYDTAIMMFEMCRDTEVNLTMHEFKQYVQDIWEWTGQFTATSSKYSD